jgi:hypothetical protein
MNALLELAENQRELMDDRVSTGLRAPRAAVNGDGASAMDFWPNAESHYRQAYFAQEKQEGNKPSFPFIDRKYSKNIWRIPIYWGISRLFKPLVDATSGSPDKGTQILNAALGMVYNWTGQLSDLYFRKGMPKLAAWRGFANGQSTMKVMYTIEVGNFEMPIFEHSTDPVELIRRNFAISPDGEYVVSRFNRKLGGYCSKGASWVKDGSALKYTRGDYGDLIDADLANNWFARDYTWDMQQFGPVTGTATIGSFLIKSYGRPSKMGTFFRNMIGDKIYDVLDIPFDMLGPAGLGLISRGAQQAYKDSEYKAIAAVRRSVIQTPRKNLAYDLKVSDIQPYAPDIINYLSS